MRWMKKDDFAEVCQDYYNRVYRFLLALSGSRHQAEDLVYRYYDGRVRGSDK